MPHDYAIIVPHSSEKIRHNRFCARKVVRYTRSMRLRLKELRKEKGWTQKHVAELAGMSVSYYADMERGDKQSNANRMNALATAFGVPVNSLIEDDSESDDVQMFYNIQKLSAVQKKAVRDLIQNLSDTPE